MVTKSQMNNSTSKQMYSFTKEKRFYGNNKAIYCPKIYDLPNQREMRATSFGYGKKADLAQTGVKSPAPNVYSINRAFDKSATGNKNAGFSFGLGRD